VLRTYSLLQALFRLAEPTNFHRLLLPRLPSVNGVDGPTASIDISGSWYVPVMFSRALHYQHAVEARQLFGYYKTSNVYFTRRQTKTSVKVSPEG
jgi:hypothetical protein